MIHDVALRVFAFLHGGRKKGMIIATKILHSVELMFRKPFGMCLNVMVELNYAASNVALLSLPERRESLHFPIPGISSVLLLFKVKFYLSH